MCIIDDHDTHLDILHCSKGSKELPQNVLLCLRRQVVDEDAPARAVGCHAGQQRVAGQEVAGQGGEPEYRHGQLGRLTGRGTRQVDE